MRHEAGEGMRCGVSGSMVALLHEESSFDFPRVRSIAGVDTRETRDYGLERMGSMTGPMTGAVTIARVGVVVDTLSLGS